MDELKTIKIGDKVPDFALSAYLPKVKDFATIKVSDVTGKGTWLVLFFYPADYTFVCPTELADVAERYEELQKEGAEVIAVSTDTQYVHYAWHGSEKMLAQVEFPMGSDSTHRISQAFGVYDEASGLALRGTFIIDPDNTLMGSEVNYFPVGRNADELVRKLKAFKYVRGNPAQVCPAKWHSGKKTLTPGKDLVGKVGEKLG